MEFIMGLVSYTLYTLVFHEDLSPIIKIEREEFMRLEGISDTEYEHSYLRRRKKRERRQVFAFSIFMFLILERIKETLENVPGAITPNVSNYYSEHSLTNKHMPC